MEFVTGGIQKLLLKVMKPMINIGNLLQVEKKPRTRDIITITNHLSRKISLNHHGSFSSNLVFMSEEI